MKRIGVGLVGIGRTVAEHNYVAALFHVGHQCAEIDSAQHFEVRDHSHSFVRPATDRAIQLVGTRRQRDLKRRRRADIERLQLLFEPLPFELERVEHCPAVGHRELDFASGDGQLREIELPLRQPNTYSRAFGRSSLHHRRRTGANA